MTGWGVEVWGACGGWTPVVDGFTEVQAEAMMAFIAAHRADGTTGLRVTSYEED